MLKKELEARVKTLEAERNSFRVDRDIVRNEARAWKTENGELTQERDDVNEAIRKLRVEVQEHIESSRRVREIGVQLKDENTRLKERMRIINDTSFSI